jgi:Family of unknown function (DUF6152)
MKGMRALAASACGLILAAGAQAHHSFTATYDESDTVRIEGTLVAFHFRNPHASVDVLAEDENGQMVRWGIEWGGAGQLANQGVTRETLKAGDHVVITGNPSRDTALHRLRMRSLLRPSDGYGWGFEGETFD